MKVRVICTKVNDYNMFIVQRKVFGFWIPAFYFDSYWCLRYFKSGISAEKALNKFSKRYYKEKPVVAIEEHKFND